VLRFPLPDPGEPDLRSAGRYLAWSGRGQLRTIAAGARWGVLWMGTQALSHFALGKALVLDEATALLDPPAARHLERSLSAVPKGRTVVAIAHQLHTASDADRVAVVEGRPLAQLARLRRHCTVTCPGCRSDVRWADERCGT
jgi:ABC-type hemin transport system ATPase subunit